MKPSQAFMMELLLATEIWLLFLEKSSTTDFCLGSMVTFVWVLNMTLGNTVEKLDIQETSPQSYKTLFLYSYVYFVLLQKSEKHVTERSKKFNLEVSLYFYIKQANQSKGKGNLYTHFRSSHSQIFFRIGVLKNFAIFTGKQLCLQLY